MSKANDEKLLLTAGEAARKIGVNRNLVKELRDKRKLPFVRINGDYRYPLAGIESWIAQQTEVAQ